MTPGELKALLSRVSCSCENERELQGRVSRLLSQYRVGHHREIKASGGKGRFDFFLEESGTVIETKTLDGRAKVLRQLKSYADAEEVKRIIVISRQPMSLPTQLSGKPIINCENWRNFA